jgi:hypothetical protein
VGLIRQALDLMLLERNSAESAQGRELLDWCEIALEVCRHKKQAGQTLKNGAGLIVKIIKDPEARPQLVGEKTGDAYKERFRLREKAARRVAEQEDERRLILEYEQFRESLAAQVFEEMPEGQKNSVRAQHAERLRSEDRFRRLPAETQAREIDHAAIREIAQQKIASFERWRLRRKVGQAVLPFMQAEQREAV